jgi:DNA-binding CsgD family transcriptional regulator
VALRRVRIQRLLDEALAQGAMATQEDLARALQVTVRTIKRDCADLRAQGIYLPTRGNLQGIGRGQTHKAQIVGRWMRGETYDQIALYMHHSLSSIRRYVQTFVRVVHLNRRGFSQDQTALLLQISRPLVKEYLAVYRQHDAPEYRERLAAQLKRLAGDKTAPRRKKGAL